MCIKLLKIIIFLAMCQSIVSDVCTWHGQFYNNSLRLNGFENKNCYIGAENKTVEVIFQTYIQPSTTFTCHLQRKPPTAEEQILFVSITISFLIAIGVISIIVYFYKESLLICLYSCRIFAPCISGRPYDEDKEYDAFVDFFPKDLDIIKEYVDKLENGRRKFKFCYCKPEETLESILKKMVNSKEIIILMTKDYLESADGRVHFYLAMQATSMDAKKQLILIKYPDVGNIQYWGNELKHFVNLSKCIERNDPRFWSKLLFALPHKTKHDDNKAKKKVQVAEEYV